MLRGRATERAAIDGLLDRMRAGQGGGMVLRGEPGIGKTALLEVAGERAIGLRVLRSAGVEAEADLGYATLHRLLLPVLEGVQRLPEPQARGLGVVFGQATGPPPDRFLVALATLSELSELAEERPVLCLVDDAHWADRPSLDTLAFVARRLEAEPIALVLAARTDEGLTVDLPGLADLPVAGLDIESARALLVEHGGDRLSVLEQDELLRATGCNPLAIRELPTGARGGDGTAEPLPLADGLQQAFLERARRRAPAAQRLLLLMAADGTGRVDVLRRAAAALGADSEPFPPDELDELLTVAGPVVAFRHPLIRSAVYHGAGAADRRAAHRTLAAALGEEPAEFDRRAWHLGNAADGPDAPVAGELERSAERTIRRAGPAAAAAALTRAAELSTSDLDRARRSVAAATAWWQAGRKARAEASLDQAEASLDQAEPFAREAAAVRRDVAGLRALIELRAGSPANAVFLLRPVIPEALADDRQRAIELLILFGEASYHASAVQVWAEIAEAVERLDLTGDGVDDTLARLVRAVSRVRGGAEPGLAPGDLDAVERLTDPRRLCWAGGLLLGLGEHERAGRCAARLCCGLGPSGRSGRWPGSWSSWSSTSSPAAGSATPRPTPTRGSATLPRPGSPTWAAGTGARWSPWPPSAAARRRPDSSPARCWPARAHGTWRPRGPSPTGLWACWSWPPAAPRRPSSTSARCSTPRARNELRATGESIGSPAPDTLALLTPQELRIATVVGEGATNREVAAQLFLSPRTVDYHLRKVFRKLDISSRADLIRLVAADAHHGDARQSEWGR